MNWPTPQDYNEAIQNPSHCFDDPDLKAGSIECNALGLPKSASGAFASVFKITTKSGAWAIRCFLRFLPEQTDRYKKISQFVLFDNLECTVDFHFIEKGIMVRGAWYPILKMRWVDGDTLDLYVQKHHKDAERISKLSSDFHDLVMQLETADIAHGDLQHGNIIVSSEGLRLVDYDALFVPELAGLNNLEFGHPNYQHPLRAPNHFDPSVDNFSTWLIHASLLAIKSDPSLFSTFGGGDETLLFKRTDLHSAETSPLFKALIEHESEEIRNTAQILMRMLWANPSLIPPLNASAYDLSALPNIQPCVATTTDTTAESPSSSLIPGMSFNQGEAELESVIRATTDESDRQGRFQHRKKKFRFKATAAGLSKRVHTNVIRLVDATVRKSVPVSWTSIQLREGDKYYGLGQYDKAIAAFMKVQTHREDFLSANINELIELQLRLGRAFGMANNLNMACNYFLMASKLAEQKKFALQHQRARFLLAVARNQAGKEAEAFTIINSLSELSLNLDELVRREESFGYLRNPDTLKLIESYSLSYSKKGDLKNSMRILEIGKELASNNTAPASSVFRNAFLDLLIRLGCNYIRLGFYAYATGTAVQMASLIASETDGSYKIRVQLFSAYVYKKISSSDKLHPSLAQLASTLRAESEETIESAIRTLSRELELKEILAIVATTASFLNDHQVKKKAIELTLMTWQMLQREWSGSLVEKIRWLKHTEPSFRSQCFDEVTRQAIVLYVENNIKNNRDVDDTELVLAALRSVQVGSDTDSVTLAVLDEMIRLVRKYDYLFGVRQLTQAKSLLQQYDFSNTRTHKLDDIDGAKN